MNKTTRIVSIVLMWLVGLMLVMSGVMKLAGGEEVKKGMEAGGIGHLRVALGLIELISAVLFLIPKTHRLGFLLVCSYLGGAMSIELSHGQPPTAAIILAVAWISVFLRNREMFMPSAAVSKT